MLAIDKAFKDCEHKFVNMSFSDFHPKMVCKYCDAEQAEVQKQLASDATLIDVEQDTTLNEEVTRLLPTIDSTWEEITSGLDNGRSIDFKFYASGRV
jgi:hypothetical protein